jgi:hypothetical protein
LQLTDPDELERFLSLIVVDCVTDCMVWVGKRNRAGYGYVCTGGRTLLAHRVAYETFRGPLNPLLDPDHLCRFPPCVNPWHLEEVTHRENLLRAPGSLIAIAASKIACDNGHAFAPGNIYYTKAGHRRCGECNRIRARRWHEANRELANRQRLERYRRRKERLESSVSVGGVRPESCGGVRAVGETASGENARWR